MSVLDVIKKRVSVREYSEQEISREAIHQILEVGMSGPSCVNARDWSFIVVTNPETLNQMADANGRPAEPLRKAKLGILICGDLDRAFSRAPEYWVIDGAIAAQNMILAAEEMGIGSVWLGTWPQMERVQKQKELFKLPDSQVPHSILAFGYPKEPSNKVKQIYEEDRVHFEKW